jgi:hypothetical protein
MERGFDYTDGRDGEKPAPEKMSKKGGTCLECHYYARGANILEDAAGMWMGYMYV